MKLFSKKSKKGTIDFKMIVGLVAGLVGVGLIIAFALVFIGKMQTMDIITSEANTSLTALVSALDDLVDWFSMWVLIGVILSFVAAGFGVYAWYRAMSGGRR